MAATGWREARPEARRIVMPAVMAGLAAKILAPIIAALGSAVLVSVFRIFLHGGLGAVDWMVKMGKALQVVEQLENDPTKTGIQKLEAAASQLLTAAAENGKVFARHEANFAVMVLLEEFRKVAAAAVASAGAVMFETGNVAAEGTRRRRQGD